MPTPDGQFNAAAPDPIVGWRLTRLEFVLDIGGLANVDARLVRQSGAYVGPAVTNISITGDDYNAMLMATQVTLGDTEKGQTIEAVLRMRVAACPNVSNLVSSRLAGLALTII